MNPARNKDGSSQQTSQLTGSASTSQSDDQLPDSSGQGFSEAKGRQPALPYVDIDFARRQEELRASLFGYRAREDLYFAHLDLRPPASQQKSRCDNFLENFVVDSHLLQSSGRRDLHPFLSHELPSYESYAKYLDGPVELGGLNNHLDTVARNFSGRECQELWSCEEELAPLRSDKEVEDALYNEEDFGENDISVIREGCERFFARPASIFPQRIPKKIGGAKGFRPPAKINKTSLSGVHPADSDPAEAGGSFRAEVESFPAMPKRNPTAVPTAASHRQTTLPIAGSSKSSHYDTNGNLCASLRPGLDPFMISTAKDKLAKDLEMAKPEVAVVAEMYGISTKTLGVGKRKQPSDSFEPPVKQLSRGKTSEFDPAGLSKGIDPHLVEIILENVFEDVSATTLDDVVGQESAKEALDEAVIMPALNPELFTGLITPVRGVLLYGPPGNGKTMLARALAGTCKQTFFNVSASTFASKYVGEGEKLVKALFEVARMKQPSIIFIDEIDSVLSSRKENEHEHSRKMKTEFLVQFDGVSSKKDDRLLVIGATNLPYELDAAALRRFPKRIMIPLPDDATRGAMLKKLLQQEKHSLTDDEIETVVKLTAGYSGSDMSWLAQEAAMVRVRELSRLKLPSVTKDQMRHMSLNDFELAAKKVRLSTSKETVRKLEEWTEMYGH